MTTKKERLQVLAKEKTNAEIAALAAALDRIADALFAIATRGGTPKP